MLLQDAAYGSLLRAERRKLHQAVGQVLESGAAGGSEDPAPQLGYHFQAGGDPARATHYFQRAATHALARYANRETEAHSRAALSLSPSPEVRAALLETLGAALERQGQLAEAVTAWREAIALCGAAENWDGVARLYSEIAAAVQSTGDVPGILAVCREGLVTVGERAQTEGGAALLRATAWAAYLNGQVEEARRLGRQALALAEQVGNLPQQVAVLIRLGAMLAQVEQVPTLRRALALAESAHLTLSVAQAQHNLAVILLNHGAVSEARQHLQHAAATYHACGIRMLELQSRAVLALADFVHDDLAAMEAALPAMRALARSIQQVGYAARWMHLAEALLCYGRGDVAAAITQLENLVRQARADGDIQADLFSTAHLAELYIEGAAHERAETLLTDLAARLRADQGWPATWPLHLLSGVYARTGRVAAARQILDAAAAHPPPPRAPTSARSLALARARLALAEGDRLAAATAYTDAAAYATQAEMPGYARRIRQEQAAAGL